MKFVLSCITILFCCFILDNAYAQDWDHLKRFEMQNAKLGAPDSNEQRVVFMGNSITESWLDIRPEFFTGKPYVNRGISGQTTPQMLARFKQDVIDLQPAVVAGINDIAGNTGPTTIDAIASNIFSMAERASANNITVVLCAVLPASDFMWSLGLEPAEKVIELNRRLKDYAQEHSLVYVDYFTPMANEVNGLIKELGEDGVHPNATGYAIMEPLVEAGITTALTQK